MLRKNGNHTFSPLSFQLGREKENETYLKNWIYSSPPASYVAYCSEKGYSYKDASKLFTWKLPLEIIPDLRAKSRIGVIKTLGVLEKWGNSDSRLEAKGTCNDTVVICRYKPILNYSGPIFNIDYLVRDNDYGDQEYIRELINFTFRDQPEYLRNLEVSILISNCEVINRGKSWGIALYLALLSALHRKPISQQVAATGILTTKEREGKTKNDWVRFMPGTSLPVAGLKAKTTAAWKQGVNRLVLSRYNCSPNNYLSVWPVWETRGDFSLIRQEDYLQEVPFSLRAKMKIYLSKNYQDLQELFDTGELSK